MSVQASAAKVREGLSDAIASGALPGNLQPKAEALLAALNKPVRMTLMGLPGTGKSQLLNLLAGSDVIPDGLHLPTTQLAYADAPTSQCTMPDGTVHTFDHCDAAQIAPLQPVFVQMAMPLPALRRISILEVVAKDDHIDQQRAMSWASKRTDIALWCTQSFNIPEQTLWGAMPDIIKDHGFMIVTKADLLARNELLDSTLSHVRAAGEHEFNQVLPIATSTALSARQSDGTVDKDIMRRSGGLGLIAAILREVDLGQQATIDQAAVLLRQSAQGAAAAPEKIKAPVEAAVIKEVVKSAPPLTVVPDVEPSEDTALPEEKAKDRPKLPVNPSKLLKSKTDDEFPDPLPKKKKAAPTRVTLMDGSKKTYEDAIAHLAREGRALAKAMESSQDKVPLKKIMTQSVDNVQWLADHLQDNGEDGDPLLEQARVNALDAADLIQLMQLEKQDSAVFDAVSLVVQLKHELEADLAA